MGKKNHKKENNYTLIQGITEQEDLVIVYINVPNYMDRQHWKGLRGRIHKSKIIAEDFKTHLLKLIDQKNKINFQLLIQIAIKLEVNKIFNLVCLKFTKYILNSLWKS